MFHLLSHSLVLFTGTVIVDMADLFSLRWEERAEREFELFDLQQLQLTHEVVDLEENFVEVNQYTGIITLTQRIDRDSICGQNTECTLKIQVRIRYVFLVSYLLQQSLILPIVF